MSNTDIIFIIILCVLFAIFIYPLIKFCQKGRQEKQQLLDELEKPYTEPQYFEYRATVVKKYCQRKNFGSIKMPQTRECCFIVFKTQDGRLWEGEVSIEEFSQLQENQPVIIAVADDKYCGFYIDEE